MKEEQGKDSDQEPLLGKGEGEIGGPTRTVKEQKDPREEAYGTSKAPHADAAGMAAATAVGSEPVGE